MKRIQVGKIIDVQAYKHNGNLYRQWNGVKVIEVSPDVIVLFMHKTKVAEKSGQKWVVREPIIWWFPVDKFFNTTGLIRKSGTYFYTNLSSPPIFEDGVIKYIDYDLDIKAYPDQPIKLVDKTEFENNKVAYDYPEKLISIIEKTSKEVIKHISLQDGYFNEEVVDSYIKELLESSQISKKFAEIKEV